eukprot:TRINITY_DN16541_c0_g1_i1.p1 TRINITY_DN16541_c0_g1~~TRINITY_DN16541_c0_g1_i1.p1  ORF type:complete len:232 (+),score=83.08 TRINITY_DN16541_c0_g1_i1:50-745(+)
MPVRRARMSDLLDMQNCNLNCLPENYQMKYYIYHAFCWPQLLHVHEDFNKKINGYVLAKMEEDAGQDESPEHGHITSVSVLRSARKLGVASMVMTKARDNVEKIFDGKYIVLHVRITNEAAIHLYQETLGFKVHMIDEAYYGDDEDAYEMKLIFGEDPYGATVKQISKTPKHSGILEWPEVNPDGKLKYNDYYIKKKKEEAEAADGKKADAPADSSESAPAAKRNNRKKKK